MFDRMDDYSTAGQNPLAFSRYYNSMSMPDTYAVSLGLNWRTTFDRYLHIINPSAIYGVEAERADGRVITFSSNSGTYTTDSDVDFNLTVSGTTWTLTDPNDTSEVYFQSGGAATLQSIKLRNGYTQTLHYTSGLLTSVTDTYSRSLGLSYSSSLLTTLTTPDSETFSYGYNFSSGTRLTSVSYNTTPATSKTYLYENASYPAALTGVIDENGQRYATWSYDGMGRATSSQLGAVANLTSITYDDTTGNRIVTGPLGIQETYKFSSLQGVPKVTEIDRAANGTVAFSSSFFSYDANGYVSNQTDWNGNNTSFVNNSHGLPTSITYASTSAVAHTTTISYDPTWIRLPHVVTTPGLTSTLNYDSSGNLATRVLADTTTQSVPYSTNGQSRTWTYTYTSTGQLTSIRLPRTDVVAKTAFNYVGGALTYTSDALGHITTINSYKPGGLPTQITDPNSVQTTLAYNTRLWLTGSTLFTSAGNLVTGFTYDSAGNLIQATLPDGSYGQYAYDSAHRLIKVTNPLSETQGLTLDSAGNLTNALWKNASAVTKRQHSATYDALGRMGTDIGGMGQTTTYGYDNQSNVTSIQDPMSYPSSLSFDALNRLVGFTDAAVNFTSVSYDAHDRTTAVKDPKGNTTSFVYDGFGEPIQQISPDTGTTVWHYDADGNITSKTDGNSYVTNWTYDSLDRPLTRSYPADSTLNVAFTYDQTGHGYGIGRLTSLTDQAGSLSLAYDPRGLVTSNARTISSTVYTTGYTYESAGRLSSITYASSGWLVSYARDTAGQISGVTAKAPSSSAVNLATSVTHLPFGPVASMTFGNGITDTRTFDLDYRMTGVKDANGASSVFYLSYGYNANDNPLTVTDNVTTGNSQTLTYDNVNRLSSAVGGYGSSGAITYDSNSNLKAYGTNVNTFATTSDHMLTNFGSSVSYNGAGNVTAIGSSKTMTYNKANRLASTIVSSSTLGFVYDAFGNRLQITGATPSIETVDQAGNLLTKVDSGSETDYAWMDGLPIAAIQPAAATISALGTDMLGTPLKGTNAAKSVVWTGYYQPYGAITTSGSILQDLRYPGQISDANGFRHNGFRDYNPSNGFYLEADPIGLAGGTNPYMYVRGNPMRYTDRLGLLPEPLELALGVAVGGYVGFEAGAHAPTATTRAADTLLGAAAGGAAAFISPALSGAAGRGALGVATFAGTSALAAGGSTIVINLLNHQPLGDDLGYSLLIGAGSPLLSGEAILVGGGYLGESIAAEQALALNSGLISVAGTYIDVNVSKAAESKEGGTCQVGRSSGPQQYER